MGEIGSSLAYLRDPRLAAHATSATPVWLWSVDGARVLWANPVAAAVFGATSLTDYTIDPKSTAALQIARLAGSLRYGAAPRLERLRGFGGRFGRAVMCACSRVTLADRTIAILVVASDGAGPALTLEQRVARLFAGSEEPVALFAPDGALIHTTPAAAIRLRGLNSLIGLGISQLASAALAGGRSAGPSNAGEVAIERIGADAATILMITWAGSSQVKPATPIVATQPPAAVVPAEPVVAPPAEPTVAADPPPAPERHKPLRFVWQMDADGHFNIDSAEFTALIGRETTAALAHSWNAAAAALGFDPQQQIARAIASRNTWSGIVVGFPADGGRLAVELSGLPVFDRDRSFRGYRGFGICRDLARITELEQTRRPDLAVRDEPPALVIPPSENVVPFRTAAPPDKPPSLTPVERKAFSELASRLTARLRSGEDPPTETPDAMPKAPDRPTVEVRAGATDQRPILDRLPVGVLVYRLDSLIYANRAFLDWTGYGDLHALAEAGGLDALFVEPAAGAPRENNGAKLLTIATSRGDQMPVEARLFTSPWEGESALVLMFAYAGGAPRPADTPSLEAKSEARELRAVLNSVSDGVMVLDREGRIVSVNRSTESLFGHESRELAGLPVGSLFAPESERTVTDYLGSLGQRSGATAREEGREAIGRTRNGGLVPLFMTADRVADGSDRLVAVFRDITAWKKVEADLVNARRQAERGSSAKSEFLAKISHEIRTPLNAIIGFSEVMMEERFGPIGNERYQQYLKDIHSSGGHLVSLLNDLLDLSKIEAGKLELNFTNVDLNELTQQCVALMQPQANRERVIIRTSLSTALPAILADARSVRQIVLNLLSNSIKFTRAGGQIIVSTAGNDVGEVILRVRDTGVGMSENEIEIALEPFRQLATSARWGSGGTGLGLPLTKALAEANRATFSIKSAVNAGTLVEVAFPGRQIAAE
jgi:PAS domain S-box-containing protein